jgi:VWFA-related protein
MKTPRMTAAIFCVLLSARNAAAQSNSSQTTPPPATAGQAETAAIYITAATKKGMLIRHLKPEDLTITEDKVPAKIEQISCDRPEPMLMGILVDVSGSRRNDSHLRAHYDALAEFLDQFLTANDGAYVVAFNDQIYKLSEVTSDRTALSAAFDRLRKYEPHSSTALYDAIKAAAEANFKGRSGHRILLVVGDWEDNSSHVMGDEAMKAGQRTSTTIYAIVDSDDGVQSKKSHKRAVEVATRATEETGGLAYVVEEKNDFSKALQAIGGAAVGSCRVAYTTTRNSDGKKGIKLHVEATSKNASIIYPRVRFGANQ